MSLKGVTATAAAAAAAATTTTTTTIIIIILIIIIMYLVSVHFTVSEAIHRLTLGYQGAASPFFTYRLHFLYFNKPFILNYV